jgi:hypothetical protein
MKVQILPGLSEILFFKCGYGETGKHTVFRKQRVVACGFNSHYPHIQRRLPSGQRRKTVNLLTTVFVGSNPTLLNLLYGQMAEWFKALFLKISSGQKPDTGSNPVLP